MVTKLFVGKTVFITGASSGLGRALAISLSKQGASLLLMARNLDGLQETKKRCLSAAKDSTTICVLAGDVTIPKDCERAVKECMTCFGKIDYLILNAGISMWCRFENITDISVLKKVMEVNYFGMVNCVHAALSHLKQSKGMIIAISSIQGKIAVPYHSGYVASKFAVQGFFEVLRAEVRAAIDILIVSPSWIRDTQLKKHAYSDPSELHADSLAKQKSKAISLNDCAQQILRAMIKRQKELILPIRYRLLPLLKIFSPKLLNFLVNSAIK